MRINLEKIHDAQLLRVAARRFAVEVIHLWECPPAVKEFLRTGEHSKRAAAHRATWSFIHKLPSDEYDSPKANAARSAALACSRVSKDEKFIAYASSDFASQAMADAAGDPDTEQWINALEQTVRRHEAILLEEVMDTRSCQS